MSLVPKDIFDLPNKWEALRSSPKALLESAGKELSKYSQGLLEFSIKRRVVEDDIVLDFFVGAPILDEFESRLLSLQYSINSLGYPVQILGVTEPFAADVAAYEILKTQLQALFNNVEVRNLLRCLFFHAHHAKELLNDQSS